MISVVVPVYNVEHYLKRCVISLINQDIEQEYEIVLVDDGSTDRSGAMCEELQIAYPDKIAVIHKKNGGLSSARNEGVHCSKGEWVTFVDSDDYVSTKYLSTLDNLRKRFDADMSVISIKKTAEKSVILEHKKRFKDFSLGKKEAFYETYVTKRFSWYAYGKLYKREILLKHLFPDGYYEDSASLYLIINECDKIAFGDYMAEYHYIDRDGSITTSVLSAKHFRIFEVCDEIGSFIDENYPEWDYVKVLLYQNAVLQLINRTKMTKEQYSEVFGMHRDLFRRNVWKIIFKKSVRLPLKYYSAILCSTPRFYKIQRGIMLKIIGERR